MNKDTRDLIVIGFIGEMLLLLLAFVFSGYPGLAASEALFLVALTFNAVLVYLVGIAVWWQWRKNGGYRQH